MSDDTGTQDAPDKKAQTVDKTDSKKQQRKIPGNLTYLTNYGAIKSVLEKITDASKPEKLSQDFLATVLGLSGGSYKAAIPILKRVGFLTADGTPTDLYSKFRTQSARPEAVLGALRHGFAELFRKNEHVYAANEGKLTDLIVEVTGLPKDDTVVKAIRGTFRTFTSYLPSGFSSADVGSGPPPEGGDPMPRDEESRAPRSQRRGDESSETPGLALAYNINITLPETKDIDVYNVIFRSIRDNLLR